MYNIIYMSIKITIEKKNELEKELKDLVENSLPNVINELKIAREQGDLSENADYDAAKDKQGEIVGRIDEIKDILEHSEIIKEETQTNSEEKIVKLGSIVTCGDGKKHIVYEIVGQLESDPYKNKISSDSLIAKSILGKKVGEKINITTPNNRTYSIEIIKIS